MKLMMSGRQPQPPYGALYSPSLPAASSSAATFGMQQHQTQPQGYNPYWQSQGSSSGMSFPANANGFAHHTNAQGANTPAFSAGMPSTPYGGYANAAQYNPAPMQFHSAFPNSAYATSPYVHQPLARLNNTSSYETIVNDPSIYRPSLAIPPLATEELVTGKEPSPELEDGELNSGELRKSNDDLYENAALAHERSTPEPLQSRVSELNKVIGRDSFNLFDSGTSDVLYLSWCLWRWI